MESFSPEVGATPTTVTPPPALAARFVILELMVPELPNRAYVTMTLNPFVSAALSATGAIESGRKMVSVATGPLPIELITRMAAELAEGASVEGSAGPPRRAVDDPDRRSGFAQ